MHTSALHLSISVPAPFLNPRNKGGMCIPNSTTEVWMVIDVDLLSDIGIHLLNPVSHSKNLYMFYLCMLQSFGCSLRVGPLTCPLTLSVILAPLAGPILAGSFPMVLSRREPHIVTLPDPAVSNLSLAG